MADNMNPPSFPVLIRYPVGADPLHAGAPNSVSAANEDCPDLHSNPQHSLTSKPFDPSLHPEAT